MQLTLALFIAYRWCKTYSTRDSCVVTHRSTNLAIRSLTKGERTGSRIFFNLWPYVTVQPTLLIQAGFESDNGLVIRNAKAYSTGDSCVVTHHSTNLAIRSLTMGERTGSRILFNLWPYVTSLPVLFLQSNSLCKNTAIQAAKAYSTRDSCVVTHHSTNLAIRSLTMGERTGSRILFNLWPYATLPGIFSIESLHSSVPVTFLTTSDKA
ncbi:hypothetical protein BJ508DRAFT_23526 [Ascobolus immersus RN42]|uniref:Uncharacterized protein n=1 Tax=Ascobolus immersus RN42 TaxID=1160509 RepID=A0A3N4HZZ3_ASCIM|nr:hypothetical protein BJ508DRAFT_23526 [Ascobolus immersus RN42]